MDGDDNELENAGEDEDHADEHPDVEQGDVGDSGYILPHLKKANQSNSRCQGGGRRKHEANSASPEIQGKS